MKLLAFLLSFYLLALNLAPCDDVSILDDEVQTEISHTLGDDHGHEESDLCSPFCICQCCNITATQFKFVSIKFNTPAISTHDFFYLSGTEKDFTTSLLQPPRV